MSNASDVTQKPLTLTVLFGRQNDQVHRNETIRKQAREFADLVSVGLARRKLHDHQHIQIASGPVFSTRYRTEQQNGLRTASLDDAVFDFSDRFSVNGSRCKSFHECAS